MILVGTILLALIGIVNGQCGVNSSCCINLTSVEYFSKNHQIYLQNYPLHLRGISWYGFEVTNFFFKIKKTKFFRLSFFLVNQSRDNLTRYVFMSVAEFHFFFLKKIGGNFLSRRSWQTTYAKSHQHYGE